MKALSTQQEIEQLKRRLEVLQEGAENELRQQLKEARHVVTHLEQQLSEITGRPSASQIRATSPNVARVRRESISDEKLEIRILSLLHEEGAEGMNAKTIGEKLNQDAVRIRGWIKKHPTVLKRVGSGPGTRFFRL